MKTPICAVITAMKPISMVWKKRLRALQVQRSLELFGFVLASTVAFAWLLSWMLSMLLPVMQVLGPIAIMPSLWLMALALWVGVVAAVLAILSLFAYALVAIQAWLHWSVSILITGAILVLAKWVIDVKLWLVQQGMHLYPPVLRDAYLEAAIALHPVLVQVVTIGSLSLFAFSMYVQIRGTAGLLRYGESYRSSKFFEEWSSPQEPLPHLWQIKRWCKTRLTAALQIPQRAVPKGPTRSHSRLNPSNYQDRKSKRKAQRKARRQNR